MSQKLALQVYLVTEFMEGGDLAGRIRNDKMVPRQTSWYQQGRFIALGIARGLLYLHSKGIVWFDCKPGNVLLNANGDLAKIADFGLARILETTYIMTHQVKRDNFHGCNNGLCVWQTLELGPKMVIAELELVMQYAEGHPWLHCTRAERAR